VLNDYEPPVEPPQTEGEILERALDLIDARLPRGWGLNRSADPAAGAAPRPDAVLSITAPDGAVAVLLVEVKRNVEARDVAGLTGQLGHLASERDSGLVVGMVVARYLGSPVRDRLAAAGLAFADATGNLRLSLDDPGLFLRDVGADRDPWRGPGRPRDSFRGPIAARVVRALADFVPPMTVPELIKRSEVSSGGAYRVVDFLERQDLLERRPRGAITRVDWRRTIELWSRDYTLNLEGRDSSWLAPRGIEPVLEALGRIDDIVYTVTGSVGAAYFAEYARARLLMVYSDQPSALGDRLNLRPTQGGANVLMIRPTDAVVYARAEPRERLMIAAPSQLAGDLLNGSGRAPSEAQALLDWMERSESAWRR
jgi:hypothetical protein